MLLALFLGYSVLEKLISWTSPDPKLPGEKAHPSPSLLVQWLRPFRALPLTSWHLSEPHETPPSKAASPRQQMSRQGEGTWPREAGPRGGKTLTIRRRGLHAVEGQGPGPTVEDKQSSENMNWTEASLSKVCGSERARWKRREESSYPSHVLDSKPHPPFVKIDINPVT